MKNLKLHTVEVKKQDYKKHLERLSLIYRKDKDKKKVLQESRTVDKLMAATHRLHETSSKFRMRHKLQTEKLETSKDWTKINCSMLSSSKQNFYSPSHIVKNERFKIEQKSLQKQNKQIFFRLMKVKPTIQTTKLSQQFNQTRKVPFFQKINTNKSSQLDFSSILNSSIIRPQQRKRIILRLNKQNEEVVKVAFAQDVKEVLNVQKLYFFEVTNNKGKSKESKCFSAHELLHSELCIYKEKNEVIEKIQVKELFHQMKSIVKGHFEFLDGNDLINQLADQAINFVFLNKRAIMIGAKIQKKNLKSKGKLQFDFIKSENPNKISESSRNLPSISQPSSFKGLSQKVQIFETNDE